MKQINIDAMDAIVSELAAGKKFSEAMKKVYITRTVQIPIDNEAFQVPVKELRMSTRTTNALFRQRIFTLADLIKYATHHQIRDIRNMGTGSCIELMETILNYCWMKMSKQEQTDFLIRTVELNEFNLACYA